MQYDIKFNSKKSVVMVAKIKEDEKQNFPSFFMADQALNVVNKVRYLVHVIRNDDVMM